jgi:large conductance mechanosensitive channel
MSMLTDFRDFINRGSVVDLAVGVIIGAAFGKIVTSLVNDLVMPPIGFILGGVDFSDKKFVLKPADAAHKVAEVAVNYGTFVNTLVQFLIIAAVIFLIVRAIASMQRKPEVVEAPAEPTPTEALLTQIRDLLANRAPSA